MRKTLEAIRARLEKKYPDYPKGCCAQAAQAITSRLGYGWVVGSYRIGGKVHHHWWNEDGKEKRIDITANQYDDRLPRVQILSPGDDEYERYRPELRSREVRVVRPKRPHR